MSLGLWSAAFLGQALLLWLVIVSLGRQQGFYPYFHGWQLTVSALVGVLVAVAVVAPGTQLALQSLARRLVLPPRAGGRRPVPAFWPWFTAALFATFAFLSTTIYTDDNIALAPLSTWQHVPYTSEEFAAVLNGLTPLVDFTPQYTSLLPYLAAPVFALTGLTVGSFTTVMALLSAVGLLSVFVALVRVTGRGSVAALLYLTFLGLTFYPGLRDGAQVHTVGSYYAALPLRYFFPLLLTSLVVAYATRTHRWRPALVLGGVAGAGLATSTSVSPLWALCSCPSSWRRRRVAPERAGGGRWRPLRCR